MKAGSVPCTCLRCGTKQFISRYNWQAGKGRCKNCGGPVEQSPEQKRAEAVGPAISSERFGAETYEHESG